VAYVVATADDLPDTGTIKRRLAQFETVFARALTKLYTSLADSVQLSSLSVAVCPDRANQHVSLWHYLNSPEVPVDLLAEDSGNGRAAYVLTIQPALFGGLMHVRRDCADDAAAPTSLAGDLVACLAAEAGAELARIFEYQIALLSDGLAIELLAGHAAHCVVNYMTSSGRHLDRNTIVLGAVRGEHVLETTKITPRLSVIVGQKELKWELDEILKRPGLRKELFLFSDDVEVKVFTYKSLAFTVSTVWIISIKDCRVFDLLVFYGSENRQNTLLGAKSEEIFNEKLQFFFGSHLL